MSRPKGSKNKPKTNDIVKNTIQKINARIKAIEKRFEFNDKLKSEFRNRLKDIVPDSSYIAKSGLLKVGKQYDEEQIQVLINKMPTTAKKMEKGAQKTLEAEDKDFIGPQLPMAKRIVTEIQARLEYEEKISEANLNPFESKPEDWKDVTNALDKKRPEILAIDRTLVDRIEDLSDGLEDIKRGSSYTRALSWMEEADKLRSELERHGLL